MYYLVCLNESFSKLITSVGEERAGFSAIAYSIGTFACVMLLVFLPLLQHKIVLFMFERVSFSSWERLRYYTPRHLCRGVYSFRLSVRPFVCSLVRSFVSTSVTFVEFASKFCVKVSQVVNISATTYQKAFIFGP